MALAASAASCGSSDAVGDLDQIGVGRPGHLQALERHRRLLAAAGAGWRRLMLRSAQIEARIHRAQHRVRFAPA